MAWQGYRRYRGETQWIFVLHRLSGLGVFLFLCLHIFDTLLVTINPQAYDQLMALFRTAPFAIGESLLVFTVFFHALNGVRIIVLDLWKPEWWESQKALQTVRWTLAVTFALWVPTAIIMLGKWWLHSQ